jgi:tetratricopeptide (TPR) repeat protein
MSIALAANTIRIYQPYLEHEADSSSPAARYMDVLKHSVAEGTGLTDAVLNLYIEAAITDPRFQHTFDLLGSCDLQYPIPLSLIGQHLTSSFYGIAKEELAPPTADQMARYRELTGLNQEDDESILGLVKALLPFLKKKPPSSEQLAEVIESADDMAHFVRECPLFAFKKFNSGFEYVEVHQLAQRWLPTLFLKHTAVSMDKTHLLEEEARFERGAWFRQLRNFDPVKSLEKFHQTLPGISAPGVMTSDQFKKHPPIELPTQSDSGSRFSTTDDKVISYSEYQHLVSHHHRIVSTLNSELKSAGGEYRDIHLKQYLQPHFAALSLHPIMSSPDSLLCEQALLSTEATTASIKPENYQEFVSRYEDIIAKQKRMFGSGSQIVARTMTDLADFKYSFRDVTGAHQLLLASLGMLEKVQARYADEEYKFDVGLTYTSLAYVYDDLGDKRKCKDLLERALAAYQTMPKDGQVSKRQRKLVASSLTNIAHAYLSLGDLVMAKKYIDLASVAHQNLYVDAHPESVRAMNVSSNIYALLGDKSESIRLRTEAGKIKAKLDSKPLLV